jgi:phosphatidylglycerophosphatase A
LAVLSLFFLVGVWACEKTAQELRSPDPAVIVWDEVVGFLFGMTAAPPGWTWIVIGFVLFRVFDIVKPWPIREMDRRIGGGLGIMLDDLAAGAATWIALQAISRFLV